MPSEPITVAFATDIYDTLAIQTTIEAYASLMNILLDTSTDNTVRVNFSMDDGTIEPELIDAFCNHVLYETILQFRATRGDA
jgi:hypothetical protein